MDEVQHWDRWQKLFRSRARRELPALDPVGQPLRIDGLAVSLAKFQRREAAECRVLDDVRCSAAGRSGGSNVSTAKARVAAIAALHDESRRHSHLLAIAVRLLGGELERPNSFRRRRSKCTGIRRALAVDVVSTAYYMSVTASLPASRVQSWLAEIAEEKRTHVEFRARLARRPAESVPPAWVWRCLVTVSAASVLLEQRRLFRALGISAGTYWGRCLALAELAHKLVSGATEPRRSVPAFTPADGLA